MSTCRLDATPGERWHKQWTSDQESGFSERGSKRGCERKISNQRKPGKIIAKERRQR